MRLLSRNLPAPDYSTLSRRSRLLPLSLSAHAPQTIWHPVIDSSGLKVYGEGEWKVRVPGADKRRTWRKLHIPMDAATHHVTAALLTDKEALDRNVLPALLQPTETGSEAMGAEGAYDFEQCSRASRQAGAVALIPPRRDAVIRGKSPFEQSDENLRGIRKRGRKGWKKMSGYHQRSLVACAFFRRRTLFSDRVRSRRAERQITEARIRCGAMYRMWSLGMPRCYAL